MKLPKVYYKNISNVPEDEYIMLRKNSIGASDVASMLGVGFNTPQEVIAQKAYPYITEEEREIGKKPNVRKGKDLEPLILQKYVDATEHICSKPSDMYEIVPGLTVNYDAIRQSEDNRHIIPVEIKYVSTFGNKYWKRDLDNLIIECPKTEYHGGTTLAHLEKAAAACGIPVYYYTQIQTQMLGLEAPYGDLCPLFDKDWEIQIYRVPADKYLWTILKVSAPQWLWALLNAKGKSPEENIPTPSSIKTKEFEY